MAEEKLEMITRDPEMLRAYEQYEKAASDWTSGINGARREGRKEGREEEQKEIAKKALAEGATVDFVRKITGLDEETIRKL
jgi:predicted transposase/invertase (TIGR01784 family)